MESEISRDTKTLIRSLLTSNPQQMTLGRLIQDYKNEVGCDIPYRQLGFNSAEQYLNSIPDTVRVQGRGNGAFVDVVLNETSRHINEMIAKQKKAKHGRYGLRSSLKENRQVQVMQPQAHYSRQNYPVYQQPLLQYPYQGFPSYMQNTRYPQQPQYCQPAQFHQLQHFHQPQRYHQSQHYPQQSRNTTSRHNPPPNKQIPNIRPVEIKKEPEAIKKEPEIKREPPKIPVIEPKPSPQDKPVAEPVSKLVRNEQQTPSSTSRLGIDWKARAALPSYIKEESGPVAPKPQKPLLLDMVDDEIYDSDDEENMVPEDVRRKLQRLIESHPEGIWCCDLPKLYYNSYNTELKYMAYGFRTMSEMCIYLKKEFHCIRLGKADFKLYDKRKPRPPDLSLNLEVPIERPCDNSTKDELRPSELKDLFETELPSIPEEAVQYLQDIPRQWLPEDVTQGQFIDLNIGEVYDPSKFWFITRFDELNDLMDEMQTFYTANAEKLAIPNCMFREGLYCAALFLGEYHRAVIVGKIVPNKAKVYYIDYGTIYITDFKDICYLHKKFSQLPAQAIRGRLSNVVPLGKMTQWPNETSKAFLDLVRMKSLVGRLDKIDNKKQLVYLTLIEPRGEASKDLYINQALVDQKLAVATLEDQIDVEISKHAFPVVKHLHLFPTFEEIEQGIVPSAIEMITLTKTMPFELIYPHYFKKFYYKNDLKELQHPAVKREEDSSICETSTASFESFKQNVRTSSSLEEKEKVSGRTSMFKLKTTKDLLPELDSLKLEGDEVKQEVPPQDTTARVLRPPPGLKPIIDASGAPFSYSNVPQCVPAYYPPQQERVPVQNFYNIYNMVPGGGYYPIQNVHNPYQMQLAYPSQRDQICTGWEGPPFEQFPQPQQILPPPCQNYPEWSTKVSNESVGVKDISIQTPEDCGLWKSDDEDSNMNLSPKDDTVFQEYLQNLGNVEDANPVDSRTNGKFSADNSDENCEETVKEIKKRYVTQSEFHGKLLHVVNLNDETFVLTEEIIKSCSNKIKSIVDLRKRLMIRHVPIVLKDMNLNAIDKNVLDELYSEGIIPTTLTSAFIQVVPVAQVSPLLDFLNVLQV